MNLQQAIVCTKEALKSTETSLSSSDVLKAAERLLEKVEADRKKILQIRGKALQDMRALAKTADRMERPDLAIEVMTEALEALGFSKVVELYESYKKWEA